MCCEYTHPLSARQRILLSAVFTAQWPRYRRQEGTKHVHTVPCYYRISQDRVGVKYSRAEHHSSIHDAVTRYMSQVEPAVLIGSCRGVARNCPAYYVSREQHHPASHDSTTVVVWSTHNQLALFITILTVYPLICTSASSESIIVHTAQ